MSGLKIATTALALLASLGACARTETTRASGQLPSADVTSMQLVSAGTGYAVTDRGLQRTTDGGDTWKDVSPPEAKRGSVKVAWFLDESAGWAVASASRAGGGTLVYRTTDGGRSWTAAGPLDAGGEPTSLQFVDARTGFASVTLESGSGFSAGRLASTADGGATWRSSDMPAGGRVAFRDASTGWLAGGPSRERLYRTADGGASWTQSGPDAPEGFSPADATYAVPVVAGPGTEVVAAAYSGRRSGMAFLVSEDAGRSWKPSRSVDGGAQARGVVTPSDVVDEDTWVAATPDGSKVHSTRDRGRSWKDRSPNGLPPGLTAIDFVDDTTGWALVRAGSCAKPKEDCEISGRLYRTRDGGQTWTERRV